MSLPPPTTSNSSTANNDEVIDIDANDSPPTNPPVPPINIVNKMSSKTNITISQNNMVKSSTASKGGGKSFTTCFFDY
eukprot:8714197-Ditylum_brightwellii.AAC.2